MIFGPCVLRFRGSQNKRPPVGEAACLVLLMERLLAQGSYAHVRFACAFLAEFDGAVYKGEERVIFTDTHVFTGVVNHVCATLSFGLGGIQYTSVTQKDDAGNKIGTRKASNMRFRLNVAAINFGMTVHLWDKKKK